MDSLKEDKKEYNRKYMKEYRYKRPVIKGKYVIPNENDYGKEVILIEERCDDFNELWDYIFKQVIADWNNTSD